MAEAAEKVPDEPQSETDGEPQHSEGSEVEARAGRMGWVPKDEFRGDESRWVDAETFLDRGEKELPILRERLRKQDSTIASMERDFADFKQYHKKTVDAQYQRALKEIETRKREAVENADTDAYEQAEKDQKELNKTHAENVQSGTSSTEDPVFVDWVSKNEWFQNDLKLQRYANAFSNVLRAEGDQRTGAAFLKAVEDEVKERFPDKFGNPRRKETGGVEGGGKPAPKKQGRTYSDLPPEAKQACDRYVKRGLITKEEYVKDYEWE